MDIPVQPIVLNDIDLEIEADNFAAHVNSATLTPTSNIVRFKGMRKGTSHAFPGDSEWTCGLGFAQDWDTPGSLSRHLYENEGQVKTVKFRPRRKEGADPVPTWTARVIIFPGAVGGEGGAVAVGTVTLGVEGRPTLADE